MSLKEFQQILYIFPNEYELKWEKNTRINDFDLHVSFPSTLEKAVNTFILEQNFKILFRISSKPLIIARNFSRNALKVSGNSSNNVFLSPKNVHHFLRTMMHWTFFAFLRKNYLRDLTKKTWNLWRISSKETIWKTKNWWISWRKLLWRTKQAKLSSKPKKTRKLKLFWRKMGFLRVCWLR